MVVAAQQLTPNAWAAVAVASLRVSQKPDPRCCCVVLSNAFDLVLDLANRGVDLDEKDNQGQTALHLAVDAASARERSGERALESFDVPTPGSPGWPHPAPELRPLCGLLRTDRGHALLSCTAQAEPDWVDWACQLLINACNTPSHRCSGLPSGDERGLQAAVNVIRILLQLGASYMVGAAKPYWMPFSRAQQCRLMMRCHVHLSTLESKQVAHASLCCRLI